VKDAPSGISRTTVEVEEKGRNVPMYNKALYTKGVQIKSIPSLQMSRAPFESRRYIQFHQDMSHVAIEGSKITHIMTIKSPTSMLLIKTVNGKMYLDFGRAQWVELSRLDILEYKFSDKNYQNIKDNNNWDDITPLIPHLYMKMASEYVRNEEDTEDISVKNIEGVYNIVTPGRFYGESYDPLTHYYEKFKECSVDYSQCTFISATGRTVGKDNDGWFEFPKKYVDKLGLIKHELPLFIIEQVDHENNPNAWKCKPEGKIGVYIESHANLVRRSKLIPEIAGQIQPNQQCKNTYLFEKTKNGENARDKMIKMYLFEFALRYGKRDFESELLKRDTLNSISYDTIDNIFDDVFGRSINTSMNREMLKLPSNFARTLKMC
jgi:hypothetical protein